MCKRENNSSSSGVIHLFKLQMLIGFLLFYLFIITGIANSVITRFIIKSGKRIVQKEESISNTLQEKNTFSISSIDSTPYQSLVILDDSVKSKKAERNRRGWKRFQIQFKRIQL